MNTMNGNVRWVVQGNLTSQSDLEGLRNACRKINTEMVEVTIIPFSTSLSGFEIAPGNIYYGSTTFNALLYNDPQTRGGVFFDDDAFSIKNYFDRWGKFMLNYGAVVTSFQQLINTAHPPEKLLFIRPDNDSKSFSGEVIKFSDIKEWYQKLTIVSNTDLSLDSPIVVSEPYNIKAEWRLWIVNKKVVAASRYREYFRLSKQRGCPQDVVQFAESRCQAYTPHDVFVMDICQSGDNYYIVECGCMNGAGFYNADIDEIVRAVTKYFKSVETHENASPDTPE
jgi:hypothetical protein